MDTAQPKTRVLVVDDDPITVRIYRDGLTRLGFEVNTAADGLAALQALRTNPPHVVVLDLMMPRFSGVEVLKFIRSHQVLAKLPVIVLSNAYMDALARDAAALEAQKGLLKIKCNPALLAGAIKEVLEGQPAVHNIDQLLAASPSAPPPAPTPPGASAPVANQPKPEVPRAAAPPQPPAPSQPQAPNTEAKEQARQELMSSAHATARNLRELFESFQSATDLKERELRLQALYRKVHFLTAMGGIAEHQAIAQMASAFEALLFGMMDKLPKLEPSMERTTSMVVEFLEQLLAQPTSAPRNSSSIPLLLVVDDDRVTNRLVVSALRNAQLQARATENPEVALHLLQERHYDLILLDIEMPGMDGLEACRRLRALPGYEKTPVIYVTSHDDFLSKARTMQSGGNDLIAKPIVPSELAAKVLMHLLKSQITRPAT